METTRTELVEEGVRRDRLGRRRVTARRRQVLLADYERSGLTQAAFARKSGIHYQTFVGWRKLRLPTSRAEAKTHGEVKFAEVALPAEAASRAEWSVQLPAGVIVRGY